MPLAGHACQIGITTTSTTATFPTDEATGIKSIDWSPSLDLIDVSDFSSGQFKKKLAGLKDGSVSVSGDYEPTNTAIGRIQTAAGDGTSVWAQYHFDPTASAGSRGFKVESKVKGFKISAQVDGAVQFSADLEWTGLPVAI